MSVAIIPARGGSKRIHRKNVRLFHGRPMLAWSVSAAVRSGLFDRIIVSTDDDEIAEIAREAGAETPFRRPAALADDNAATVPVIAHALEWLASEGVKPALACCIYATAPFIQPDDLLRGRELLTDGRFDYAFSATEFGAPVQRGFIARPDGGVEMLFPEYMTTRSQDLPTVFHDAGQFYWGRSRAWTEGRPVFTANGAMVLIPHWRVQDIDSPEDWARAELIAPLVLSKSK